MEWVSVKDKLPINPHSVKNYDAVEVIVVSGNGDVFATTYSCGNVGSFWHKFDCDPQGGVTHWISFPEPPTK